MIDRLKNIIRLYYPYSKTNINRREQKKTFENLLSSNTNDQLKIVIGSSQKYTEGWIPSEAHFLDLLEPKTWLKYFQENHIDGLLAEHVWEHLTPEQGKTAVETCHTFLKKGGRLRVAIPDGFHSDPKYIDYVKPGGHGYGSDNHKILYNYKSFSAILSECGFKVECLEYFDENGLFHSKNWTIEDGFIYRSIRYDERNQDGNPNYTSLILDAIKL
ncbi:Protein distantly related to SAM-dependent methyltransferases [hydrothermal vent metagenome]|uniref:Protein distantly related to SAM-dependent methyltransferases n=1 Tax=hydrothermal vent metagenome TaxID=652676 RepID=A0A3B0T2V3_9ZZZZ